MSESARKLPSLCIAIAAYNEEAALPGLLERSARVARESAETWGILVIDDGSADSTPKILADFASKCPQARVLRHPQNKGICQTLKEIFTMPARDWVFFIPGDGQVPPEELSVLLPYTKDHDIVHAWRKKRADPLRRLIGAWIYNLLISISFRRRIHDVDGAVLWNASRLSGLDLKARSSYIHAEFLGEALKRGLRHIEVPTRHAPRIGGEARGATPRVILTTAWEFFTSNRRKPSA